MLISKPLTLHYATRLKKYAAPVLLFSTGKLDYSSAAISVLLHGAAFYSDERIVTWRNFHFNKFNHRLGEVS